MNKIIGRKQECSILKSCYESERAELVAVYGRRRVGKTYLVKNYFKDEFAFYITGVYQGSKKEQLAFFNKQLCDYSKVLYPIVDNWFDAFDQLKHYLSSLKKDKIVVFIDELPWLDTPRSRFLKAFELFWNSWASDMSQIKLIVCGSATTWMMSHLLGDKGGLHNRVTRRIKLSPFNLSETEQFLKSQGIVWNRYQIAEAYMILGGTPYYLQMLQKSHSLSQNIDYLFFSENAELKDEYTFLFRSLFNDSAIYRNVVELLSKKSKGMTRAEIQTNLKLNDGGNFTQVLENLCNCDFIRKYSAFGKKERDVLYQLTDLFTLFYLKFVKNSNGRDEHLWSNMIDSELFRNISKTKKALHLTMITTYGLKKNSYSGMIQSEVILDDLFL